MILPDFPLLRWPTLTSDDKRGAAKGFDRASVISGHDKQTISVSVGMSQTLPYRIGRLSL
jgi:hypothetical protein